jgi:hypothetical protein
VQLLQSVNVQVDEYVAKNVFDESCESDPIFGFVLNYSSTSMSLVIDSCIFSKRSAFLAAFKASSSARTVPLH